VTDAGTWLAPGAPVISVDIDGQARAYPLAILIWHEIVNDNLNDTPIAVTYCPLCNSSIVFDRRIDGAVLRLGVSGNLRFSDMVMWDDLTQSWWQQFTGEAIVGAYTGQKLPMIPSQVVAFEAFAARYPDAEVLSRATGAFRSYGTNPYTGYDGTTQPFLFTGELDPRLPATEHVLGAAVGDDAAAYPFAELAQVGVINDTLSGLPVVAVWQPGGLSALDRSDMNESRMIGTAALYSSVIDGETLTFAESEGVITDTQTGSTWDGWGMATSGPLAGRQLEPMIHGVYFWFAWAAFQPETRIVTP
jgi:hypothetical protein